MDAAQGRPRMIKGLGQWQARHVTASKAVCALDSGLCTSASTAAESAQVGAQPTRAGQPSLVLPPLVNAVHQKNAAQVCTACSSDHTLLHLAFFQLLWGHGFLPDLNSIP